MSQDTSTPESEADTNPDPSALTPEAAERRYQAQRLRINDLEKRVEELALSLEEVRSFLVI